MADALNRRIELHTCRQQHTVLRHMLSEFPTCEPFSGAHMMLLLQRLKAVLVRHLRLEDEQVYPELSQALDEDVRATALTMRAEVGGLMRSFEDFDMRWNNCAAIDANPMGFLDHWTSLRTALEMRMYSEDQALFPQAEVYFTRILTQQNPVSGP